MSKAIRRYEEALAAEKAASKEGNQEIEVEGDLEFVYEKRISNPFDVLAEADEEDSEEYDNEETKENNVKCGKFSGGRPLGRTDISEMSAQSFPSSRKLQSDLKKKDPVTQKDLHIPQSDKAKFQGDSPPQTVRISARAKKKSKKKRAKQRKKERKLNQDLLGTEVPDEYFNKYDTDEFKIQAADVMREIEHLALGIPDTVSDSSDTGMSNDTVAVAEQKKLDAFKAIAPDRRHLNPDFELRRLFGAGIVESERRAEDAAITRQQQRSRIRGRGQRTRRVRKRALLVTPRESWIERAPGMSMILDPNAKEYENSPPGVKYFKYKLENPYALVQGEYRHRVSTHDPNALAQLVAQYPYHVDSLLQLSEVYREMGEPDRSAEMLERALFILESAWTAAFSPESGLCRLSYDHPENRSLYVALLRHSQLLARRGLYRTSLEVLKLLLSLDPENDPMGVFLLIDSIALAAKEITWLEKLPETFTILPLHYLPNFAASKALARFISSEDQKAKDEAETMLAKALLAFPIILRPLNVAIDESDVGWTKYPLYDGDVTMDDIDASGALFRICRVYAERSKVFWKSEGNKALLRACSAMAGKMHQEGGSDVEVAMSLRKNASEWIRLSGLYRNVTIGDYIDNRSQIPAELVANDEEIGVPEGIDVRDVGTMAAAGEFLRSMMPWARIEGETQGTNEAGGVDFLQALRNILGREDAEEHGTE